MLPVFTQHDRERLERVEHETKCIHEDVKRLLRWIALKKISFFQIGKKCCCCGGCVMDFSIVAGATGSFQAVKTPANGTEAPGDIPQWHSSDPSVVLTPSADGLTCDAAVPAGFTAASFNLSISAVSSDSTQGDNGTVGSTHVITVTPATPPTQPLTGIDFVQTAG